MSEGSSAKTEELNRSILPPDVKVVPFYDRSELVHLTTDRSKPICSAAWFWF